MAAGLAYGAYFRAPARIIAGVGRIWHRVGIVAQLRLEAWLPLSPGCVMARE